MRIVVDLNRYQSLRSATPAEYALDLARFREPGHAAVRVAAAYIYSFPYICKV